MYIKSASLNLILGKLAATMGGGVGGLDRAVTGPEQAERRCSDYGASRNCPRVE